MDIVWAVDASGFGGDWDERFFAEGATTIRGYPKDRVGPTDSRGNPTGGNAQVILNAEWRVPVWKWLSIAGFVDTGTVMPEVSLASARDGHARRPGRGRRAGRAGA